MKAPEPCPYCGVRVDLYPETRNLGVQVECANCGVRGPFKPTMEEAVSAFDRMRPPTRITTESLGMDSPWPVTDVLERLAQAAEHLLSVHSCDGHGYEEVIRCAARAREIRAAIAALK